MPPVFNETQASETKCAEACWSNYPAPVLGNESQVSEAHNLKVTIGELKFAGRIIPQRAAGNVPLFADVEGSARQDNLLLPFG